MTEMIQRSPLCFYIDFGTLYPPPKGTGFTVRGIIKCTRPDGLAVVDSVRVLESQPVLPDFFVRVHTLDEDNLGIGAVRKKLAPIFPTLQVVELLRRPRRQKRGGKMRVTALRQRRHGKSHKSAGPDERKNLFVQKSFTEIFRGSP